MPSNFGPFSTPSSTVGSTPSSGWRPTQVCDEASGSASAGATSTWLRDRCQLAGRSCRSVTSCTRHAARPAPLAVASTSRSAPSSYSNCGAIAARVRIPVSIPQTTTRTSSPALTAPHSPPGAVRHVQQLVARSGLPRIRLHDLRHTHATFLLKSGVPIKVVSERLGHSTPAFTMATYQHVLPGMQAASARAFAALLEALPASTRGSHGRRPSTRSGPGREQRSDQGLWWRGRDMPVSGNFGIVPLTCCFYLVRTRSYTSSRVQVRPPRSTALRYALRARRIAPR